MTDNLLTLTCETLHTYTHTHSLDKFKSALTMFFYLIFLHFSSLIFKYMDSQIQETQSVANTFKTSSCSRLNHKRFHFTPEILPPG